MRLLLLAAGTALLLGLSAGCNTMPEEDPGYYVQTETTSTQTEKAS